MEVGGVAEQLDRLEAEIGTLRATLLHTESTHFETDELKRARRLSGEARSMLDGFDADLARRAKELRGRGNDRPVDDAMNPDRRRPTANTGRDERRSEIYDQLPELGDATGRGELPGEYADVIAQALNVLSDEERAEFLRCHQDLHEAAGQMDLHRFRLHVKNLVEHVQADCGVKRLERQRRDRSGKVWTDIHDDMVKVFAQFDPETGARVKKAIDDEIDRIYRHKRDHRHDRRTHDQIVADTIANLIVGKQDPGARSTELLVLIDLHTLLEGEPAGSSAPDTGPPEPGGPPANQPPPPPSLRSRVCETGNGTTLPVETVLRLACEADIIPVVLNSDGVVLYEGTDTRLATRQQRLALRAMYSTCAIDGCDVPFDRCEIHHVRPWMPPFNGPTNLDNLIPLCQQHHHQNHDDHWHMRLDPTTRTLTVTLPDGSVETHPLPSTVEASSAPSPRGTQHRRRPPPAAVRMPGNCGVTVLP